MSGNFASNSNPNSSDVNTSECKSMVAINRLIDADGIILGTTYEEVDCGLKNLPDSRSVTNYHEESK